jgi:hypothetical protein
MVDARDMDHGDYSAYVVLAWHLSQGCQQRNAADQREHDMGTRQDNFGCVGVFVKLFQNC